MRICISSAEMMVNVFFKMASGQVEKRKCISQGCSRRVTLPAWIESTRGKTEAQFRHCDVVQTKTQPNNEFVTEGIHFQIGPTKEKRRKGKMKGENRSRDAKERTLNGTIFPFSSFLVL